MKYSAVLSTVAWTAVAVPSSGRRSSPGMGSELPEGMPIVSDGASSFDKRQSPALLLGSELMPNITIVSDSGETRPVSSFSKRTTTVRDCGANQDYLDKSTALCAKMARVGQKDAQDPNSKLLETFFKNTDEDTRNRVARVLGGIADECENKGKTVLTCNDRRNMCPCRTTEGKECPGWNAWTFDMGGAQPQVLACPAFFGLGFENLCGRLSSPAVLVHEMSHALFSTKDFQYGLRAVRDLSAQDNLQHADTFALYANAVAQGCTLDDLRSGRPSTGEPPVDTGNTTTPDPARGADPIQGTDPTQGIPIGQPGQNNPLAGNQGTGVGAPQQGSPRRRPQQQQQHRPPVNRVQGPQTGGPQNGNGPTTDNGPTRFDLLGNVNAANGPGQAEQKTNGPQQATPIGVPQQNQPAGDRLQSNVQSIQSSNSSDKSPQAPPQVKPSAPKKGLQGLEGLEDLELPKELLDLLADENTDVEIVDAGSA